MATASLAIVHARLVRAHKHFKELESECDRLIANDPNSAVSFIVELDEEMGDLRVRLRFPEAFPLELGLIVGEILHHLRASLDNLAWQLVVANGGTPGPNTKFPIFKSESKFDSAAAGFTKGMSRPVQTKIKGLQPFNAWPEHPTHSTLWKIHELDIINKHRLPHLICLYFAGTEGQANLGNVGTSRFYRAKPGPVENDAVLIHLKFDPERLKAISAGDRDMNVHLQAAFDPTIHNPGQTEFMYPRGDKVGSYTSVLELCKITFNYIENVLLPTFEGDFP